MSWTIQNFPLPSNAELQAIISYVNANSDELDQAKADKSRYLWGALVGDALSLFYYSQALATIERIETEYRDLITSEVVWDDGSTSYGILYLQYVLDQSNAAVFSSFGVKFAYGTTGVDTDTLGAGWNNYVINYYSGNDSVTVASGTHRVLVNLGDGNDTFTGSNGSDGVFGGVGNDILRGGGNVDVLDGGLGDDKLFGDAGDDLLYGGVGNDLLNGGIGGDFMEGGIGNDIYVVDNTDDTVVELANQGTDTVQSSITYTLNANVENLTLTGTAAINGTCNGLNNVLTGNSGINTLTGGLGNDTYVIGAGDTVVELADQGTDTVQSSITYTLGANVENLTLTGTAAINGTGNTLNNVLTGNSAANILTGGLGNDTYVIGAGDTVVELANQGTDTVRSSVTYTLGANVENLILTGTAAINGTGNTLNNVLTGNTAANILNGGVGKDSLTGSTGVDKFIYKSIVDSGVGSAARDVITDFRGSLGERIDLSAILITHKPPRP